MIKKETLVIIPARGGSKGIPDKNILPLIGTPLIEYTIQYAREFFQDSDICLSTDSAKILAEVEKLNLKVPFQRPAELATDHSSTYDVIMHALDFYRKLNISYNSVLLLQPTSPFRLKKHFLEMKEMFNDDIDMVVSVGISKVNPAFSLFEEEFGYLVKSKPGEYSRRQDCPPCYFYNGSMYLMQSKSLEKFKISEFPRVKKYIMNDIYCQDIDTQLDWAVCETIVTKGFLNLNDQ